MPIDNLLERDVRVFATGRKSGLFRDTVDGVRASAVVYSAMLPCRACRVEPLAWLRHVLTELPQRAVDAEITAPLQLPKNRHCPNGTVLPRYEGHPSKCGRQRAGKPRLPDIFAI